jgi:hypothetical protein
MAAGSTLSQPARRSQRMRNPGSPRRKPRPPTKSKASASAPARTLSPSKPTFSPARDGITLSAARKIVTKQCSGILLPALVLPFDDDNLAGKTVADVLADPAAFEGETLADPLEGIEYGRCKAMVMRREDHSCRSDARYFATPRSAIQIDSYTFRLLFGEGLRGAGDVIAAVATAFVE